MIIMLASTELASVLSRLFGFNGLVKLPLQAQPNHFSACSAYIYKTITIVCSNCVEINNALLYYNNIIIYNVIIYVHTVIPDLKF